MNDPAAAPAARSGWGFVLLRVGNRRDAGVCCFSPARNSFDLSRAPLNAVAMPRLAASGRGGRPSFILSIAWLFAGSTVLAAASAPRPTSISPAAEALVDFYLPPDYSQPKLAPDGLHVAMIARSGDLFGVAVFGLNTGRTVVLSGIKDRHAVNVWWLGNRRLLVQVRKARENDFSHIALNLDGSDLVEAWRIAGDRLTVLDPSPGPPDEVLVSDAAGVWSHHLRTNRRVAIQTALPVGVGRWYQDRAGEVRAAFGRFSGKEFFYWRAPGTRVWQSRASTMGEPGVYPLGFDRDPRYIWVEDGTQGDRPIIARLDTQDGAVMPAAGLPNAVAGRYTTEGEHKLPFALQYSHYGDVPSAPLHVEDREALASLNATLPNYEFSLLGRVPNSTLWVLNLQNSRVPGTLVLFDWKSRQLSLVGQSHGQRLPEASLAAGEHLRFKSGRGTELTGMLWRPPGNVRAPLVLLAPAALQTYPARDTYYADVQALVAQGFAVAEINQRGRVGFGRTHQLGIIADPAGSLREDYGAALDFLRADPQIEGARAALFGEEIGATFVLAAVAGTTVFAAAVAIDPPAEVTRDSLYGSGSYWSSMPTYSLAGGWSESERIAESLTPKKNLPAAKIPILIAFSPGPSSYPAAEQSVARLAPFAQNATNHVRLIPPRRWPQDFRSTTDRARDRAETMAEVGAFLREQLRAP
jgi:dipeptidyl aminopeptidase/acylaminoacyl peptidase